ncbi:MAG: DUF2062 domain-containing protein [Gallionella sp.]|nr:DUF2062 domain-containing protein [Gallionella sp.]
MKIFLKRMLPDAAYVQNHRWLRWLGPALHHPHLWHFSRRGVALGVALGIFFGLLIPIAQIPLSAASAVILRANVPSAVASTLITNPITFVPIYYGAYRLGAILLGEDGELRESELTKAVAADDGRGWIERIAAMGKPLLLGLAIMASAMGVLAYLLVSQLWRLKVLLARRRRRRL